MFRRRRSNDDFAEEIKSHLELEADALKQDGLGDDDARRKAKAEFGSLATAQERFRQRHRIDSPPPRCLCLRWASEPARPSLRLSTPL